ncbi:hypothetical protein HUA74_18335 [Myxococcus sp. CA051A]|uniref:hypothetical protein n=1 Tax=Myxococcus sp. CA051A TaxID=2741739 RepID=UPI00157B56A6|nr:hypothetical protein [Myxococcus sp. CA051A]NTX62615.1 hypothetical protein [Myxococcus sp. CA051A]
MTKRYGVVAWVLSGVCAVVGALATYLPDGGVQRATDSAAQVCEAAGLPAYPRDSNGDVVPRPADAQQERSVGLMRQGNTWVPVALPSLAASSTVEDVGPADARGQHQ